MYGIGFVIVSVIKFGYGPVTSLIIGIVRIFSLKIIVKIFGRMQVSRRIANGRSSAGIHTDTIVAPDHAPYGIGRHTITPKLYFKNTFFGIIFVLRIIDKNLFVIVVQFM